MDILANSGTKETGLPGAAEAVTDATLSALMDEFAHGVIVVGVDASLLHANHAARHELGRRRILFKSAGLLQAGTPESTLVLQEALLKAADGKRCLIELDAPGGPSLTLAVLPLKPESAGRPARAALLFARASVCDSLMLCFFARSHGLTSAEEQVLGILCQGFSAPEAAQQLKVAVSTVRSHVRSLCAKTRSRGVRELVNRVAVLPPVAPAFLHEPVH